MRFPSFILSAAALAAVAPAQVGSLAPRGLTAQGNNLVFINEIRTDQNSSDNDEYFELLGLAGDDLDGLTYIVIGDGATGSGTIESVVDLAGQVIPADGTFLAAESSFSLGTADMTTTLNFENGDNVTHLVALGFTGMNGMDLDADDDGVLDSPLPWLFVLDAVSLVANPTSGDKYYASTLVTPLATAVDVGPAPGGFAPAHVYRCTAGGATQDVRIGEFFIDGLRLDTPGELNASCVYNASAFCDPGSENSVSATGGKMGLEGSPFIARNDAVLYAEDVPDFFGVFVQGTSTGSPTTSPIGGTFCLGGGIQRLNGIVQPSGNRAEFSLDFNDPANAESAAMAGVTLYYQFFHRDTFFPQGGNWTNGIAVTWAP
ncbi:MAG: hypothetical protein P8R43_08395 [Planctomycetota bacterium]|nr:hypothetical protein [Planctomycetota bacterium]